MELSTAQQTVVFESVSLHFNAQPSTNVFAKKLNRTLGQTIVHARYTRLQAQVIQRYAAYLDTPLGTFLYQLKLQQDLFYQQFLNPYGDALFCSFRLDDAIRRKQKGLYAFVTDTTVQYLGRCRDSFGKRINQGYGIIHPKNCYIDGQATNCHLNALISRHQPYVAFYVHPMIDDAAIMHLEKELIRTHNPPWNIALKTPVAAPSSDAS